MRVVFIMLLLSVYIGDLPLRTVNGSPLLPETVTASKTLEILRDGIRHLRSKEMKTLFGKGMRQRQREHANSARRYLEKQLLVHNRTVALLGDMVERILHSSRELNIQNLEESTALGISYLASSSEQDRVMNDKEYKSGSHSLTVMKKLSRKEIHHINHYNMTDDEMSYDQHEPPHEDDSSMSDKDIKMGFGHALEYLLQMISNVTSKHNGANTHCQQWTNCKENLQEIFLGPLPACPCHYPSSIFYENKLWDKVHQRYFRWKDASGETERLDIYKPGAEYCIRSLLAYGTTTLSVQHCCYNKHRKLITRGSGAGNPNFVSPEVSETLHYKLDILPWRICKGDFTRYNKVRPPNNDNFCEENPNEEEFRKQVESATSF